MSIQYSEHNFSENMPFDEALAKFKECLDTNIPVQALHIGSDMELNARKMAIMSNADMRDDIENLKKRVDELNSVPKSNILFIPTISELKEFGK